jgi:hypothetical protein
MQNWRDSILMEFIPHISKLTLVADPDQLLTEEKMAFELHQRGFDIIDYLDSIEFRFVYEQNYRSHWDAGNLTDLVVVLRSADADLSSLPYDLLQCGRKLSFNLGDIFPNLSYPVIEELDRNLLDQLYEAQIAQAPDRMGDNATKDFILRSVYNIAPELIQRDSELLRTLLRYHYSKISMPQILQDRMITLLSLKAEFSSWPIGRLLSNPNLFYDFLQERWPIYLTAISSEPNIVREPSQHYGINIEGPVELPFGHEDIRVYIDNLFVDGSLSPVEFEGRIQPHQQWIRSGVIINRDAADQQRLEKLFERVSESIPDLNARHSDWINFAMIWSECTSRTHLAKTTSFTNRFHDLQKQINQRFESWLRMHYASLISLPPISPTLLHHIPRFIQRSLEAQNDLRVALVVIDGLSLDQWNTLQYSLKHQNQEFDFNIQAIMAWIPTLTSFSRQSIFSGRSPAFFPNTIMTTNGEDSQWKQFWEGTGLNRQEIVYQRGLGNPDSDLNLFDQLITPKTKVVGLVIDKVDSIMHGMQLGSAGMHNQIKQWCDGGFLNNLLMKLSDNGFQIYLTSDHGNIECQGIGRPSEGVTADAKGERVRIYPTTDLRDNIASKFISAVKWEPVGLPGNCFPLLASGSDAFINPTERAVCHGGASIEEVIVPFIRIDRR